MKVYTPDDKSKRKELATKLGLFLLVVAMFVLAEFLTGCQTRITAEKHPEQACPIEAVVNVGGEEKIITTGYQIASGGWYATARSPLWATEGLEGLSIGVCTNGMVTLTVSKYDRDLSTNSVVMVKEMLAGGANLATSIADAYVKIAGGGAQAATAVSIAKKAYSAFSTAGGDAARATVSTDGDVIKVSDGDICTSCTIDGNCTSGRCSD